MRTVIQRVLSSSVTVDGKVISSIGKGMMVLCGFVNDDTDEDLDWMCRKIAGLRIFDDDRGVMNLSVMDVKGEILAVSQFTLLASTKKGNRPSYVFAAGPEVAVPLYEKFKAKLSECSSLPVQSGIFGADMKVALVNDGPVTICIDSKNKF